MSLIIVFGVISCISIILAWRHYSDGLLFPGINSLRSYNILSMLWPDDVYFLSLHFKVLRYVLLGIGALLITWYVKIPWIIMLSRYLILVFFILSIPVQKARTHDWKDAGDASKDLLKPIRRACTVTFFYPLIVFVVLMVGYGFRP